MTTYRPCICCGTPATAPRCPACATAGAYGPAYQRTRAAVLAAEQVCWLCGEPPRPGDPLTADHVVPVEHGGGASAGNVHAAHRSCNSARGARQQARTEPRRTPGVFESSRGNGSTEIGRASCRERV